MSSDKDSPVVIAAPVQTVPPDARASALVVLSAHALGSLGFAISIFAIWFSWLLPAMAPPTIELPLRRQRRHSFPTKPRLPPTVVGTSPRRVSAPVTTTPIISHSHIAHDRHVAFADPSAEEILVGVSRRNTMPEYKSGGWSMSGSPLSSTSTLPTPPVLSDHVEDKANESDSSRQSKGSSLQRRTSKLNRLKLTFHSKSRQNSLDDTGSKHSDHSTSTTANDSSSLEKTAKPPSSATGWLHHKNRAQSDPIVPTAASSTTPSRSCFNLHRSKTVTDAGPSTAPALQSSFPSIPESPRRTSAFLSRHKTQKAPTPRTTPYGAPYFATPPAIGEVSYPDYLRTLPQFDEEAHGPSSRAQENDSRGRDRSINRGSLNQPKKFPAESERRSASEDGKLRTPR